MNKMWRCFKICIIYFITGITEHYKINFLESWSILIRHQTLYLLREELNMWRAFSNNPENKIKQAKIIMIYKKFINLLNKLFCRLRVPEHEGADSAWTADPGLWRQFGLWLQPRGLQALLSQVVQGRPGVLQVHAQHGQQDRGVQCAGRQCGCEWEIEKSFLFLWDIFPLSPSILDIIDHWLF